MSIKITIIKHIRSMHAHNYSHHAIYIAYTYLKGINTVENKHHVLISNSDFCCVSRTMNDTEWTIRHTSSLTILNINVITSYIVEIYICTALIIL